MDYEKVLIQHDNETGLYHPAWYRLAPLPGGIVTTIVRYKSVSHHTTGFEDMEAAQVDASMLAAKLDTSPRAPDGGWPVRELSEAGPDILILAEG
jgi:hypothetical protein